MDSEKSQQHRIFCSCCGYHAEIFDFCWIHFRDNFSSKISYIFATYRKYCLSIHVSFIDFIDGFEVVRDSFVYLSDCVRNTDGMMFEWPEYISYYDFAQMLIISSMITIFAMAITYYDSDVPGVCPPTPFSPRKAKQ